MDEKLRDWADWTRSEALEMFETAVAIEHPYSHMSKYDPETVAGLAASLVVGWDRLEAARGDRERLRAALQSLTVVTERPANRGIYIEHGIFDGDDFASFHFEDEPCEVCAALRDTAP